MANTTRHKIYIDQMRTRATQCLLNNDFSYEMIDTLFKLQGFKPKRPKDKLRRHTPEFYRAFDILYANNFTTHSISCLLVGTPEWKGNFKKYLLRKATRK